MKKLIFILMVGSLFAEEPIVTIIGKSGIYVAGTIKKYEKILSYFTFNDFGSSSGKHLLSH